MLRGMWDLPGSGIEPVSAALAGGFFTTEPPRKARFRNLCTIYNRIKISKPNYLVRAALMEMLRASRS